MEKTLEKPAGYKIVLTADRTLTAGYRTLFDGMLACSQTTKTPRWLMNALLLPRAGATHRQSLHSSACSLLLPRAGATLRARVAPLGLRRVEAALLAGGFDADDVAVVDDASVRAAIGPATRIVGISSGEPCGLGMNSTTMTAVAGGEIYPEAMFRRLLAQVKAAIAERAPSAKIVLGGPGAWQVTLDPEARRKLGIDCVIAGYAEGAVADVFRTAIRGGGIPETVDGKGVPPGEIPPIAGASTMGVIEVSRGCGLGCPFCTIARVPMAHLPESTILADAATNAAAGVTSISLMSEDLFRYGAAGWMVRPDVLLSLLGKLRAIEGLRLMQLDHANVASVAQYSDGELLAVHDLLVRGVRHRYPWVNLGVETASGRLMKANGCTGKMAGCPVDDWGELCGHQVRRLSRAGFFPLVSLIAGIPGETEDDVRATIAWVESLRDVRAAVFPMLFAPVDGRPVLSRRSMHPLHWRLMKTAYRMNFLWVPRMCWDNQAGAGMGLAKRCLLQVLGRGQTLQWKLLFAVRSAGARREPTALLVGARQH